VEKEEKQGSHQTITKKGAFHLIADEREQEEGKGKITTGALGIRRKERKGNTITCE